MKNKTFDCFLENRSGPSALRNGAPNGRACVNNHPTTTTNNNGPSAVDENENCNKNNNHNNNTHGPGKHSKSANPKNQQPQLTPINPMDNKSGGLGLVSRSEIKSKESIKLESPQPEMISRRDILLRAKQAESKSQRKVRVNCDLDDEDIWNDKEKLCQDHIQEVINKWEQIDDEIWAKVICMEKNRRVAKAYARLPFLIVDGSETGFDGIRVGLKGFENCDRPEKTKEMLDTLGEGIKIKMDDKGNILVKRVGKCTVHVKSFAGTSDGMSSCIGKDIIESKGKLEYKKVSTLFDIRTFQASVTSELKATYPQTRKLESLCISAITFGKESGSLDLLESPSWIMIINMVALELLRNEIPFSLSPANSVNQSLVSKVTNGTRSHHQSKTPSKNGASPPKSREIVIIDRKSSTHGSAMEGSNTGYRLIAYEPGLMSKKAHGLIVTNNSKPQSTSRSNSKRIELTDGTKSTSVNKGDKVYHSSNKPISRSQLKSIGVRLPDPDYDFELPPIHETTIGRKEDPYYCGLSAKVTHREKREIGPINNGYNRVYKPVNGHKNRTKYPLISRFYSYSSSDSSPSSCETSYSTIYNSLSDGSTRFEMKNGRH